MRPDLEKLQSCLHTVFSVYTAAGIIELRLEKAIELPRSGLPDTLPSPLNLTLTGPAEPLLSDAQYYLDHPLLGRQLWFLNAFSYAPFLNNTADDPNRSQRYQVLFT